MAVKSIMICDMCKREARNPNDRELVNEMNEPRTECVEEYNQAVEQCLTWKYIHIDPMNQKRGRDGLFCSKPCATKFFNEWVT